MGYYRIVVEGIGPHHNEKSYDADALTQKLVSELEEFGHSVKFASFDVGNTNPGKPKEFLSHVCDTYRDNR